MAGSLIALTDADVARFWSKVALPNASGCMFWPSGTPYGQFWAGGQPHSAHRLACLLTHGEPADPRLQAAHSCRQPRCVAPNHLRWATPKENQSDREVDGTRSIGEAHPQAKLTEAQVLAIRNSPGVTQQDLARRYGVHQATIYRVLQRRSWAHLR